MIILGLGRDSPKPPIVLGQIFLLQKRVRLRMRLDFLQTHFLHQTILVGAVISLHAAFRLRRIGRDDVNPQPLAHLPKLRHRHHPLQLLFPAGFSYVHVLPIRIQRHRNPVFLDPRSQHRRRRPDRLLTPHARQRISAGVVHHVHSGNHAGLVPPTSRESFHPSAPVPPHSLSVLAACGAHAASASDSIALLITSSAAVSARSLPHDRR